MDNFSALIPRFSFQAKRFFTGKFCSSTLFPGDGAAGHLHVLRQGLVIMEHDDQAPLTIDEPTLVFYPRSFQHRLVVPPGAHAQLLCATIDFKEGGRNPFTSALPDFLQIPLRTLEGLAPILDLLFDEAAKSDCGKDLIIDHLCDIVVVHVLRHALKASHVKSGMLAGLADPGIASTLTAIHKDLAHPWRVEDMANLACMSRSKFAKYFHDVVGATPADYLAEWRMAMAENLLKAKKPVKAVAVAVGYCSQPAFTKAFIGRYGISPKQWVRQSLASFGASPLITHHS